MTFVACENENFPSSILEETSESDELSVDVDEDELNVDEIDFIEVQNEIFNEIEGLDLEGIQDLDLIDISDLNANLNKNTEISKTRHSNRTRLTSLCLVKDADRCPFGDSQPASNMWWPENETDFFNPTAYFSSTERKRMFFATFSNGTALLRGITTMNDGECKVFVNVWLNDRKTYSEFIDMDGEFKREIGCASQEANPEEQVYYDIDASRSLLYAWGGDCLSEGLFGLELRGNDRPSDPNSITSNFRSQLGVNGAAFDSNIGAFGFSTWGFITDPYTGEQLYVMDFDFRLWCVSY